MEHFKKTREYKINQSIEIVLLNPKKLEKLSEWEKKFLRGLNQSYTISNSLSVKQKNKVIPILKKHNFLLD